MAQPFKLSVALKGHDDDVRGVSFPAPHTVVSASRDATVRVWTIDKTLSSDHNIISHASSFINAVACIPPSKEYPEGLVVTGSREGLVEVRTPDKKPEDSADAILIGHANNVCALDVSPDGKYIVSGSWDTTGRIWNVGKWSSEESVVLQGHDASVWAVLAYDSNFVITGSADKFIRVFDQKGKLIRKFQGSDDVVRALVRLPGNSAGQFASAGNDAIIKLWTLEGVQVGELYGHENFIYSLAVLPSGELLSSSEDRTVRVWKDNQCVQTITHPAISVWSVAASRESGDIVTGASDKMVRIFTRSQERLADKDTLAAFDEAVQASSIPQQSLGDINKTDMPGPEFLTQKSGTKEGQVQLIKEANGNVAAYQWSTQGDTWVNVGTVVDSASSSNKVFYEGQDYDYVFDVDVREGEPPLKLPYNSNQNPYEAARKFIERNELSMEFLDQVAGFITQNAGGTAIGADAQRSAPSSDPWGTENRYRPGEPTPSTAPPAQKILPQKQYLTISTANHQMILKKIIEFNQQLSSEGEKSILTDKEIQALSETVKKLETVAGKQEASITLPNLAVAAILRVCDQWPEAKRLPLLDLLRLFVAASSSPITFFSSTEGLDFVTHLSKTGTFAKETAVNNVMLAIRSFANLFASPEGRKLADEKFEDILALTSIHATGENKNLAIALTTLYINYAVLFTTSSSETQEKSGPNADRALGLLAALQDMLKTATDPEALYRALVATGTVLCLGRDFADVAREGLEIEEAVDRAEKVGKEERIKIIIKEIRALISGGTN